VSTDSEGSDLLIGLVLVFLLGAVVGGCGGSIKTMDKARNAAVEAGVGEWQVDPKTGATTFVYKKGGCQ